MTIQNKIEQSLSECQPASCKQLDSVTTCWVHSPAACGVVWDFFRT
jgi:hypothetical protein